MKKITKFIFGATILSTSIAAIATGVANKDSATIRMVSANRGETAQIVRQYPQDIRYQNNFSNYQTNSSNSLNNISTKESTNKMTADEYQQKLSELNDKYAHMFAIKDEINTLETKQSAYWSLNTCYQQELKELSHEWAGVEMENYQGMPPQIYHIVKNIELKYDGKKDSETSKSDETQNIDSNKASTTTNNANTNTGKMKQPDFLPYDVNFKQSTDGNRWAQLRNSTNYNNTNATNNTTSTKTQNSNNTRVLNTNKIQNTTSENAKNINNGYQRPVTLPAKINNQTTTYLQHNTNNYNDKQ